MRRGDTGLLPEPLAEHVLRLAAMLRPERWVGAVKMAGRMPGTAALRIVADDETGELESATILGQFGDVPDNFGERLTGE